MEYSKNVFALLGFPMAFISACPSITSEALPVTAICGGVEILQLRMSARINLFPVFNVPLRLERATGTGSSSCLRILSKLTGLSDL